MKYKRILLKLSGESLQGREQYGLSPAVLQSYAEQIRDAAAAGVQIGIVIGGGNIFRGLTGAKRGFDRVKGDQMGMLATIINSLALQSALEDNGVKCKVLTSIRMEPVGEYYSKARAIEYLEAGYVVIVGGGTSNPYFTTDSAAEGHARGRHLHGRSGEGPRRREVRRDHLRGGARPAAQGHGPHGLHALPREPARNRRVRHGHRGQSRQGT